MSVCTRAIVAAKMAVNAPMPATIDIATGEAAKIAPHRTIM